MVHVQEVAAFSCDGSCLLEKLEGRSTFTEEG